MRKIWKMGPLKTFDYNSDGTCQSMRIPEDSELIDIQVQDAEMYLWFTVNSALPKVERKFALYGTGWDIPDGASYCDTVHLPGGEVWHVFEL